MADTIQTLSETQGTASGPTDDNVKPRKELEDELKYHEAQVTDISKNAYQLLNMYIGIHGFIIAAVSQMSSSSKCYQWKYFLMFTTLLFLIYGIPLLYMAWKFIDVWKKRDRCILGKSKTRSSENAREEVVTPDGFRELKYYLVAGFIILLLLGFNVYVGFASHAMLCGNKHVSANATCLQVLDKLCTANN